MPARSQGADQQAVNPFKSRTGSPTFPQCIWEVLVDHRDGISIAAIVEELQQRGLRDVSGLKNPGGQVANNLGRHLDHFTHKNHLWGLRLYEPAADEADITVDSQGTAQQAGSIENRVMQHRTSRAAAAKFPISSSKRATRSSSPVTEMAGAQLVGLACTLWWDGEQEWFPGVIQSWNPANSTYTIQYDDGDQETGAVFKSYSLEQSPEGQQVVKVYEVKPGNYMPAAERVEDSNAASSSAAKVPAEDMCVSGAGDASDEDLPLFTLAERHANSPEPDAKGSSSSAEAAAVLEMHDHNKAPASSKANSETHAEAGNSQAVSQNAGQSEAEISAAEATAAPGSQGSPEPSSAPPAAVQPRTTRSQSKRMSIDASPSISIASKQSIQAEPEGKPSLTKPPSGRRKRSITPAHPPAAAKASPPPAEAAGTAINAKTASAGKKRQRTPDTATGAATKKAAVSRRSSRLSAIALTPASADDLHHEEQDSDCRPLGLEVALPTTVASPADKAQSNGGVQLVRAANAADDEQQSAEAAAGMLSPTSDRTAPTDTTAVVLTDATPATAAGVNCTEATASVAEGHVKPVEAVSAKQPHSPVPDSVGASAQMLHQTKQPTQADEPLLDQHQGTSGAQSAAISKTAVSQESLAPASKGHAPTDGKDAEVAEASTAVVVSEDAGAAAAADVPAQTPTDVAEGSLPCLVALPMAAGELPTMDKAPVPSSAAAAAAPVANAYSIAQAANTESAAAREEAQAPISAAAAAAAPIGGVLAANTGLESAAKPVATAAEQTDVTESCASADAGGLQIAPHASVSAAVLGATESSLPTDALATEVAEVTCAVPATASETKAEAVESVASAHARPSLASSSAPTSSQVQSAESPAAATAAQATAAPPAAAAAAALATAAMLKTMSVPKPPQSSGSTRIGLPNRLSSLSKSLLGPAQQKAGSTHIRPILSKGLSTALKSDRGVKAPHLSLSEGRTGSKRKRDVSPSTNLLEQKAEAKSRGSRGSKQVSGQTRDSTVSPNEATGPVQAQRPSLGAVATSHASPEDPSMGIAASAHALPVQQPQITTALPTDLMPLGQQLPAQSPQQLLPQLPPKGRPLVSQAASQHQQLQGSISPQQQQPQQLPPRVRVPLHRGVGLVRLCIPAGLPKGSDPPPQDAAPLLVTKYSAWPFTCLWPESPTSQPPPLPSQSPSPDPSPPPMPPRNWDPSHKPSNAQAGRKASQHVADRTKHVAAAPDAHTATAASPQRAQAAMPATAHRPSGKQAPKVLIDPTYVSSALEGPFQPASKRNRSNLSVSPDDGVFGGHHASSRSTGENSRPEYASRPASTADRSSRPPASVNPTSSSKPASSQHRSYERRAPSHYSESQHAQHDNHHRTSSHRDAPHSREQHNPRSSTRDFSRERRHGRYRDDDRSYRSSRAHDRDSGSRRRRSYSTSSSSRTSSHSRERQRHSSGHCDSHSYREAQQPRGSYCSRDSSRDDRHQGSYHRDDRHRYSRPDRDRGSGRDRYDGSKGKQAHATHSHGSRTQRPDSILDRRGATDASGRDPLGLSLSPTSPSKRSHASSMSPDAAHGASHGAAHGASLVLPEGFTNGRIFWSSERTFKECMEKRLFAAKDERDIRDIGADTAVFLWNCFQRELHGVWVSSEQGNLEPHAFGGKFRCQARVTEEYMFAKPLPIETVLPILPRIPGRPGTSFEQHLDRDQVCKVWNAFVRHNKRP